MVDRKSRASVRASKPSDLVGLTVTPVSRSGRSFKEKNLRIGRHNFQYFTPDQQKFREARKVLQGEGFKITAEGRFGLSLVGKRQLVSKFFGTNIIHKSIKVRVGGKPREIIIPSATLKIPEKLRRVIDYARLEQPAIPLQFATPPEVDYYHLDVPHDVADLLRASDVHPCGYDGSGIRICMIDDGFFLHPYYTAQGYDITLVPVGTDTMPEGGGHGTGIAANALAVAPGAEFELLNFAYPDDNGDDVYVVTAALRSAKDENPDIITCSWGLTQYDSDVAAEIADAVARGIVVVFACGNSGPVLFPGCMDEVISVGGAYPIEDNGFEAATYASSGECDHNPGRQCPDVCGLVGHNPAGILIMMPTVPDGLYDRIFESLGDGTARDDGWLCASGTSSAAPQVAGVAALVLQCNPALTPDQVKSLLENTATDITSGSSGSGEAAGPGVDLATGHGLVDARSALEAIGCSCGCSFIIRDAVPCLIAEEIGQGCAYLREHVIELCKYFETCHLRLMVDPCMLVEYCTPTRMLGPGGCCTRELIAPDFREICQLDVRIPDIMRDRFERLVSTPRQGKHVRTFTARKRAPKTQAGQIKTKRTARKKLKKSR